jgi:hypothetical protein
VRNRKMSAFSAARWSTGGLRDPRPQLLGGLPDGAQLPLVDGLPPASVRPHRAPQGTRSAPTPSTG